MTTLRLVGGPTMVIEYAGARFLTDPTFDAPGTYPIGTRALTKIEPPAVQPDAVGPVDAVLLSHQQHPDNLDRSGREFLAPVPVTLTTPQSADKLGGMTVGLKTWQTYEIRAGAGRVLVTAVPARHGPPGCEPALGDVAGFVLSSENEPSLYVSGDNAALELVADIVDRLGQMPLAVLFAGGAKTALLGDAFLTLSSPMAAEAAVLLGAERIVPAHFRGWAHFTQGPETLASAFAAAGLTDRLALLQPGEQVTL